MNIVVSAYLDNNIGDDLMIKLIAKKFQEHHFFIYTSSSVVKETFGDIKNIMIRNPEHLKADMKSADVFLTLGGSVFQITNLGNYKTRIIKIIRMLQYKSMGVKIATLGSNLGPYTKIGKYLTKIELRNNDLITVRDTASKKVLEDFGNIKNYHFADDIVLNLKKNFEQNHIKNGLGISVYRNQDDSENSFAAYEALAYIADEYINKTNKPVRLFAFDTEHENDLAAAHHVYKLAKNNNNIEIIPYLGDEECFLEQFSRSEKMVAIRFHSAILSDVFNIPFLPIAYSNKMKNLMHDRHYEGKVFEFSDLNKMGELDHIVEMLVTGTGLCDKFTGTPNSSFSHFSEFEKMLGTIKSRVRVIK